MIAVTRNRPEQAISILKGLGVRAGIPDIIARLTAVQRDAHAALSEAGATVETRPRRRAERARTLGRSEGCSFAIWEG
jgi:hypothetical protein